MRNKILYITYDGILDPLGQSQILPYIMGLSKSNDFTILSYEKKNKLNTEQHNNIKKEIKKKNIKHKYIHFRNKIFLPLQIILGFFNALIIIKNQKIDFIHARSFFSGLIALFIKKTKGISFIFDMRGFWVDERVDAGVIKKGLLYRILKSIEEIIMNNSDYIIVLTNSMKNELVINYKINKSIKVIPTCVDLDKFRFKKHRYNDIKLLYFGSCSTWYNIKEIINFMEIISKYLPTHLTLILNNAEQLNKNILNYIKNNKRIKLLEKQPYNIISRIISNSNFSIIFYDVPNSKTGFCPTKLGESMACGLPVIINSSIGDCDSIIKYNNVGVVIKHLNKENYINSIKRIKELINDSNLSLRCRRLAENYFDLKKGIKKYDEVYQNIKQNN